MRGAATVALLLLTQTSAKEESCGCNYCCSVTYRPPAKQVNGATLMCAVSTPDGDAGAAENAGVTCPATCKPDAASNAAANFATMEYSNFCFLQCSPPKDAKVGQNCEALSSNELDIVAGPDGNGMDPALAGIGADDEEAPQASDAQALEAPAPAPESAPAAQTVAEIVDGGDQGAAVAQAAGQATIAAGLEARLAEAEGKSMRLVAATTQALEESTQKAHEIQDLSGTVRGSETQAALYAKSAAASLKEAKEDLGVIRAAAMGAAKEAGAKAQAIMEAKADEAWRKVAAFRAKFYGAGGAAAPMAEAANRAAAPYYAAMQRTLSTRFLYSTKAQELASTAKSLQVNARILGQQARMYQAAGSSLAPGMLSTAKSMLADASGLMDEAHIWQARAAEITKDVPTYQIVAGAAAARAATLANPAGQPPPPMLLESAARRALRRHK